MPFDRRYVYSVSSREHLVKDTIRSIRTLERWVPVEQIVVYVTPPVRDADVRTFEDLGVDVRRREHASEAFSVHGEQPRHYADKTYLAECETDEVLFLDGDTHVLGDPDPIFDGDFEVKVRPSDMGTTAGWEQLFERHDEPVLPWLPNAGVLAFKDGVHRDVRDTWLEYLEADLDYRHPDGHTVEQYALALAIASYDVEPMSREEHAFEWHDDPTGDGIVYHLGTGDRLRLPSEITYPLMQLYKAYLRLRGVPVDSIRSG